MRPNPYTPGAGFMPAYLAGRETLIENAEEYLCYEIQARDASGRYLVYIDAQTGAERELFELISEENGTLVM